MTLTRNQTGYALASLASAIFAGLLCAAHLHRFGWFYMASDDSYIYLGYVRNWVERGELLTYNPGEHSAGTTGLLYYYLLSAVASLVHLLYWPDAGTALTLTAYLSSTLLFLAAAFLLARIWKLVSGTDDSSIPPWITLAVWAASISLPEFLWGWFGGLENPLSGTLLLLLVERVLAKAPGWQIALAGAALGGCRPELLPFGLLAVAIWSIIDYREQRSLRMPAVAFTAFAGMTALIYLPCWLATGSITPSALGTRVAIPSLTHPGLIWQNLAEAAQSGYFASLWIAGLPLLFAGLAAVRHSRPNKVLMAITAVLAIYFLMRAALGLTDFSVQERYISFFWPLYALIACHVLQQLAMRLDWKNYSHTLHRLTALGIALLTAECMWAGLANADLELSADTREMNQMHVHPAQWMAQNLPKSARIMMEPAGALRVFTDFYLVDAVGLTTRHMPDYLASTTKPDFDEFLRQTGVTHIFDYPARNPQLTDRNRFRQLNFWRAHPWRHSGGAIGLYQVLHSTQQPSGKE